MKARPPLAALACAASLLAQSPDPVAPPPLGDVVRAFAAGAELELDALWDRLATADVVFLGETHLDETTHRFELAAYSALIERARAAGRGIVLAMEMFERDEQEALDAFTSGAIDEAAFAERVTLWGNYRTGYRELVLLARRHGLPVVGSNLPGHLRFALGRGGAAALDRLGEQDRAHLPPELLPNTETYWQRVARVTRGHMGGGSTDPQENLYSVQSLWDNCMGWSCVQALQRWPGALVLHVNGGFHTSHHDGTARQAMLRAPDAKVVTVDIDATGDLRRVDPAFDADRADVLVFAEARARGLDEGLHAVTIARELEFRVHVPAGASDAEPAPLLIWLGDDLRSKDAEAYWRLALGDEAAVVTVEPPMVEIGDDLHEGGRWFRSDRYRHDLGPLRGGLNRLWRYVLRRFPVDPRRVVLAGEGTGATVVAATMMYAHELDVAAIAVAPRDHRRLQELGLPDPADRLGRLRVLALADDRAWWEGELAQYRAIGLPAELDAAPADPIDRVQSAETAIREVLWLPVPRPIDAPRAWLLLEHDSPLALHWARLAARARGPGTVRGLALAESFRPDGTDRGRVVPLSFAEPRLPALPEGVTAEEPFGPEQLADGRALPLYPGPFGGSTVLVVPAGAHGDRDAWRRLAEDDVIKRRSRFARLLVAFEGAEPSLAAVLESIRAAGRRNALIVPAAFCATAEHMRRLRAEAEPFAATMALAWLPGLGGELQAR